MQESDHWLTMNIRIGSSLPLLTTAIGRTFLAHLPEQITSPLVDAEIRKAHAAGTKFETEIDALLNEIRMRGLARAPSALLPGVDAIAAPVFDYRDQLVAVMCVVARAQANITGWEGTAVRALTATTRDLSARLGHLAGEGKAARPSPQKQGRKAKAV
jgi:DNA-binding IclR family transcriptional regulator